MFAKNQEGWIETKISRGGELKGNKRAMWNWGKEPEASEADTESIHIMQDNILLHCKYETVFFLAINVIRDWIKQDMLLQANRIINYELL